MSPYADYGGFGERYFEGGRFDDGGHPAGYTAYSSAVRIDDWADEVMDAGRDVLGREPASVLVVGCAYGETVAALREQGVEAVGVDISTWAVEQAVGSAQGFVIQGDGTTEAAFQDAMAVLGVESVDLVHTERMLSCLTDAEAISLATHAAAVGDAVIHRLFPSAELNTEWYNEHTAAGWESLIGGTYLADGG